LDGLYLLDFTLMSYTPTFARPKTLVEALDHFAFQPGTSTTHVPDYCGFETWFLDSMEVLKAGIDVLPHAVSKRTENLDLLSELAITARRYGIIISRNGKITPSHEAPALKRNARGIKLKSLNKLKLLTNLLRNMTQRGGEVLAALAEVFESGEISTSAAPTASQARHRIAFLSAVAKADERAAFKMLGRLREEQHDPGEIDYLEALALFYCNDFQKATECARKVPPGAIDGPRARLIILESLAFLGELSTIAREVSQSGGVKWPPFFLRYVCQIALANSAQPEDHLAQAQELAEGDPPSSTPPRGYFSTWNRNSCQLAVESLELRRERQLRGAALEQSGSDGSASITLASLRERQLEAALALDPALVESVRIVAPNDEYREIVKRLTRCGEPEVKDYRVALMATWRIGNRTIFLKEIVSNVSLLGSDAFGTNCDLLELAYQEAVIQERKDDACKLKAALASSADLADRTKAVASSAASDRVERRLSPMGKLAFRAARRELESAVAEPHRWRDAGMISLGFFRVLELEINERLIFPLRNTVDQQRLQAEHQALIAAYEVSQRKGQIEKSKEFWDRLMPSLRGALGPKRVGIELGALEILLSKTKTVTGPDASLKEIVNTGLMASLTPAGQAAYLSGEIAEQINLRVREKFRNPPAHTRFLDIDTARECKIHVEAALNRLNEWTP
jgi:hypothetical protein